VSYYASRAAQSWLNQSVQSYAGVFVNHIRMAPYVEDNPLPKWIDLHDAISLNYKSAIGTNNGLWSWVYRYEAPKVLARELNAIRRFDKAFIVSERDKKFLVEKGGDAERILVAPVAVSDELLDREFPRGEADEICFVGKMDTVANVDAACYFATEVFPAVLKSRPGFRFVIVGAAPSPRVQALAKHPGITVTGWMKDPHALVYRAKVVVAPMRVGAGMQNKVLEAMAMGKAVVASVLAAEGIGATPGRHYAVADSPLDQAHEIIQLLDNKDRRESLGAEAKRWIREHHTWSTIRSTFIGAMASTIEEANGSLS
jgi:glycosyltransferase involved in cell wall biosynthesis